jgi:hypothetical protein
MERKERLINPATKKQTYQCKVAALRERGRLAKNSL